MEIVKFSTCPGTSKKPKCTCPIENFTCPKEQISLYLTVLKQFILSKTVWNQIYINSCKQYGTWSAGFSCKQCTSRSAGFWRSQQIRIHTAVIFLQICFYESRDSLGQNSLHPKLKVLHPIWGPLWIINFMYPYKSDPFIQANLRNKTLSYLLIQ